MAASNSHLGVAQQGIKSRGEVAGLVGVDGGCQPEASLDPPQHLLDLI
ncbi:hypothetical protein [Ornithinicoccus hortensis]|nr:hypothetical protein [Ornithinicoccus hortensis]